MVGGDFLGWGGGTEVQRVSTEYRNRLSKNRGI